MAIQVRNSVLAVKVETTEGTPVAPSAATDYVALQDDADLSPEFETLENAELKGSLAPSKSILGIENPTFSFSHYLKHSGVEGQEPETGELMEAAFGEVVIEGTEYDTVAGSTTSAVNVDTAEGASFERGQPLLVKNAADGYEIRPVLSVAGDVLTPAFNLANAPASGVNLGKAVFYKPANSGHQSVSVWHYGGNGGFRELISGSRVTELGVEIEAGQLINTSYSIEGVSYYFNPIEITASNRYVDFDDGGGEENAAVALGWYKDPHELAAAIESAMDALTSDDITVSYLDASGKFRFESDGITFELLWATGANTANAMAATLGFTVADDTGATSYLADSEQDYSAPHTPSFDASDPLVAKNNQALIGDAADATCFAASSVSFTLSTPKTNIDSICAESGRAGSLINERVATLSITALLDQYDADKFKRFRSNQQTQFMYAFGTKSGGNWEAGKSGMIFIPTATITSFNIANQDGLFALELELAAYADADGNGEAYLGFV